MAQDRNVEVENILLQLNGLAIFRGLLQDKVLKSFIKLLKACVKNKPQKQAYALGEFVSELYATNLDFASYLSKVILEDDNIAVHLQAKQKKCPTDILHMVYQELDILQMVANIDKQSLLGTLPQDIYLPHWQTSSLDFKALYVEHLNHIQIKGYGIFLSHHMFVVDNKGHLLPAKNPDKQSVDELTGYTIEREKVMINTQALLNGLTANNVLLYGDAGTGKSSTVKAIANEYKDKGLRLIEVRKDQLFTIPSLMDSLADNPLKFIIFIDDLSFAEDDVHFTALKAILEGNISARPHNVVVYATSNRRHLVKESLSSRQGDNVHIADSVEESASLSARFGLVITFLKPDKQVYEQIVEHLAKEKHLKTPLQELFIQAQGYAIRNGGRSPRVAKQFIEYMQAVELTKNEQE